MQDLIKDRVAELRSEIAELNEANRENVHGNTKDSTVTERRARRLQRLREIVDELNSLIEWKRT
jgi:hypothetical protein